MSQYKDATEIPGFGSELILYKRAYLTSDAWWYLARIKGCRGYIRRSTRETDVVLAMSHAKQSYFHLMGRQDQRLELGKRKVSELAKRFLLHWKISQRILDRKKVSSASNIWRKLGFDLWMNILVARPQRTWIEVRWWLLASPNASEQKRWSKVTKNSQHSKNKRKIEIF